MNLLLDVATDIYPISANQVLTLQIASSLERGGVTKPNGAAAGDGENGAGAGAQDTAGREAWRHDQSGTLADEFDYVMYGKVGWLEVVGELDGKWESQVGLAGEEKSCPSHLPLRKADVHKL